MTFRIFFAFALVLGLAAHAQNAAPPDAQDGPMGPPGMHGGTAGIGMIGRGVMGTVTAAAAGQYTVKTFMGETYTVHYGDNTRFLKQPPAGEHPHRAGQGRQWEGGSQNDDWRRGGRMGGAQTIKSTDIQVGDAVEVLGEIDSAAKSVGAMAVVQMDPERAKQMQQMEADYGKTWLMGKVTAIDGVHVTLQGVLDNVPHTFAADENTEFREHRNPITLADIKVGDMVRAEGAVQSGTFTATAVTVMRMPTAHVPQNGPPVQ